MPEEGVPYEDLDNVLAFDEIERVVRTLATAGLRKVRLTGDEPARPEERARSRRPACRGPRHPRGDYHDERYPATRATQSGYMKPVSAG